MDEARLREIIENDLLGAEIRDELIAAVRLASRERDDARVAVESFNSCLIDARAEVERLKEQLRNLTGGTAEVGWALVSKEDVERLRAVRETAEKIRQWRHSYWWAANSNKQIPDGFYIDLEALERALDACEEVK